MTEIVVDGMLGSQLLNAAGPIRLVTQTGQELGQFVPRIDLSDWELVRPAASEEELDRREKSNAPHSTFAELRARLGME